MNDSRNPKNPPPDDFSKTTPFIKVPKDSLPEADTDYSSDWEKTNYIYTPSPRQTPKSNDDWGKTAANINLPQQNRQDDDFGRTMPPQNSSKHNQQNDWGVPQAGFNINENDFGAPNQGKQGATSPFIQLPEAERAKYQNISVSSSQQQSSPSIPNVQIQTGQETAPEQIVESTPKKSNLPPWIWYAGVAGLFGLLAFSIIGMYLLFSKSYGYDVVVLGADPNSDIFVDKIRWGVTATDGSYKLSGLKSGTHDIEVKSVGKTYEIEKISGEDGDPAKQITVKFKNKTADPPKTNEECQNIKNFDQASTCANNALDKLGDNFTIQDLLNAMNLYRINFDPGKYNIKPKDLEFLKKASGYMKKLPPNVKIEVGGHTDTDGTDEYNQKLSENRAKSVRESLVNFEVKNDMLEERGYGEKKPMAANETPEGKFQNRRIEYKAILE